MQNPVKLSLVIGIPQRLILGSLPPSSWARNERLIGLRCVYIHKEYSYIHAICLSLYIDICRCVRLHVYTYIYIYIYIRIKVSPPCIL